MEQHTPGFEAPPRRDDGLVPHEVPTSSVDRLGTATARDAEVSPFQFHDEIRPRKRRIVLPLFLFLATCLSTFLCGSFGREIFTNPFTMIERADWRGGFIYMVAVMGILLAHEMGHFLMTLRHRVRASWPFFIPVPIPLIGTMGAVIAMQGSRDRKQLFDIGIAGPLAGLLVCIPVLCLGIYVAQPGPSIVHQPLLTRLLVPLIRPDLSAGTMLSDHNPLLMAGWVGLFVTGLNMLPISQLDGGHVMYAIFRRGAFFLAYALFFAAIVWTVATGVMQWVLMLALVTLIGVEHPPTANDNVRIGPVRVVLGMLSLLIPVLCFMPILLDERMLAALSMFFAGVGF